MPIALHPDEVVSIILPAAAYPLEIVQAARFVRDTNNIEKLLRLQYRHNSSITPAEPSNYSIQSDTGHIPLALYYAQTIRHVPWTLIAKRLP